MRRTIRETRSDTGDGSIYFLLARDRRTVILYSILAAFIGAVWIALGALIYVASRSHLSWTLIIPGILTWAVIQYVFTFAKVGLHINIKNSYVEVLQVFWRAAEIDKASITDVVVAEKLPVGREKRNDSDVKHYLGLKLADGTAVPAFFDLKKSVLEDARISILSALQLEAEDQDNDNDDDCTDAKNDDAAAAVADVV